MEDRREFIKTIGRGLALLSLAGVSGYLLLRGNGSGPETCDLAFVCEKCSRKRNCKLKDQRNSAK